MLKRIEEKGDTKFKWSASRQSEVPCLYIKLCICMARLITDYRSAKMTHDTLLYPLRVTEDSKLFYQWAL
jgi:hypothetical protein